MTNIIDQPAPEEPTSLRDFLEKTPPANELVVIGFSISEPYKGAFDIEFPAIELYCQSPTCSGVRLFDPKNEPRIRVEVSMLEFVRYCCRNCKDNYKTYALRIKLDGSKKILTTFKFGETPYFGPPTPRKVLDITGNEKEYFLKGRQAENQGLGIAAFAYYRRVVENQKDKILDEIIRVSNALVVSPEMLADLVNAKKERQFSKAIESIKHGIPQALMIQGHNPLTLLHDALSEGMHAQSDEDCLALATSIRTILSELVEKLSFALKEEAELNAAVGTLLKAKASRVGKK